MKKKLYGFLQDPTTENKSITVTLSPRDIEIILRSLGAGTIESVISDEDADEIRSKIDPNDEY